MPFEKGNKLSKGRPKGATNKTSKAIREVSAMMLEGQMELLEKKLPTLKDADYIKAIGLLYKYVLPQQKQIEMDVSSNDEYQEEIINRLDKLSDQQVEDFVVGLADEASRKLKEEKRQLNQ